MRCWPPAAVSRPRASDWPQRWAYRPPQDEVIAQLRAHKSQRIADIGCGTGILAERIQRELQPAAVYGVDLSDGMLDKARERSTTVQWRQSPAESLPFADGELDAVVSTTAFHFFDQPAALREFHRVLAPSGVFVLAALAPRIPLLDNHVPRELRELLVAAGFTVDEQHPVGRAQLTKLSPDVLTVASRS